MQPVPGLTPNLCLALPSLRVLVPRASSQGYSSCPSPWTRSASGTQDLGEQDLWNQGHLPRFKPALGGEQDLTKAGTRPLLPACAAAVRDLPGICQMKSFPLILLSILSGLLSLPFLHLSNDNTDVAECPPSPAGVFMALCCGHSSGCCHRRIHRWGEDSLHKPWLCGRLCPGGAVGCWWIFPISVAARHGTHRGLCSKG